MQAAYWQEGSAMFAFNKGLPEEVGIPSTCIKNLILSLDEKEIPMHSLLIMKDDKLVFEKYYAPYKKDTLHRMFSISKSFTAIGISVLAGEGRISLDDPITDYFPEYTDSGTHEWIKMTTIRNMLMMRTCHASTTYKVNMKTDWVESFFKVAPTHKPGTVFHYDTSAAHVLCALVEKLTGMTLLDYLKDRVLRHLDFSEDSYMVKDPFGVSIGGSGLMATPLDILKVLYLLTKKGTVMCADGVTRTLIDPEFIRMATSNLSDTVMTGPLPSESQGYGMQIWQNEVGGFVLYGMGGQLAINIPDKKMLIVTTADTQGIQGGNQVIYNSIYELLCPFVSDEPISDGDGENNASYKELLECADALKIAPPRLPKSRLGERVALQDRFYQASGIPVVDDGKVRLSYELSGNPSGFTSMCVEFADDNTAAVCFMRDTENGSEQCEISFGIGKMSEGLFPIYRTLYTAGGIWLRENVLYVKAHLIGECVGSVRFEFFFEESEVTVFMRKIEETYFQEFDGHLYGKMI